MSLWLVEEVDHLLANTQAICRKKAGEATAAALAEKRNVMGETLKLRRAFCLWVAGVYLPIPACLSVSFQKEEPPPLARLKRNRPSATGNSFRILEKMMGHGISLTVLSVIEI